MAYGQGQGGGLMGWPDVPSLGAETWAEMSGMHPSSALVGGSGTPTGGVDPDYKFRRTALGEATPAPMAGGAHMQANWRNALDFKHSPISWAMLAAIAYLGLVHLHVNAKVGPYKGSAGVGR